MQRLTVDDVSKVIRILHTAMGKQTVCKLLDEIEGESCGVETQQLPAIETADELIADAGRLPPMLVDQLLPDKSLFLLTGKPKAGKSFLALDMAVSDVGSRNCPRSSSGLARW